VPLIDFVLRMVSRIWSKSFFDRGSTRDEVKAARNVFNDTYLSLYIPEDLRKDSTDPPNSGQSTERFSLIILLN
jgi:hypothetical protein